MKKLLLIAAFAAILGACATKPIYNAKRSIPLTAQTLPLERIAGIIDAGQQRGWIFERSGPGHLVAAQRHPKFEASVDIRFDQRTYEIPHKSSTGLKEQDGTIHRRYNTWVVRLEQDIQSRLAQVTLTK